MVQEPPPGNSFRSQLRAVGSGAPSILADKQARRDREAEGLAGLVPRQESRRSNQRGGDRQRLQEHQAMVRKGRASRKVTVINLSAGGAMIEGRLDARLWDTLTLVLGEHGEVECAVRWIRGKRYGLEFAHETRVECDAATLEKLIAESIRNNFPDSAPPTVRLAAAAPDQPEDTAEETAGRRETKRHPMIWMGKLHCAGNSVSARLRNISSGGALIESAARLEPGSAVTLDLGDAGEIAATIGWTRGEQTGLAFNDSFDLSRLAAAKPDIAPCEWAQPDYLRNDSAESSPWAERWGRLTVDELSQNRRQTG